MGKGSKARPFSVSRKEFDNNFENIFGKKEKKSDEEIIAEVSKLIAEETLDDTSKNKDE